MKSISLSFLVFLGLAADSRALLNEDNQGRWERAAERGPDAEVPGFLVNMGPTGARGVLKERSFVVKHIFRRSPADGVLQLEDEVTGANGKRFSAHTFGGRNHGIEGPIQDMGLAIEDSEGGDGVLRLSVRRGDEDLIVDVQLEKLGRFSDTFPLNCEKTVILRDRANRYVMDNHDHMSSQGRAAAILALISADDRRVFNAGRRMARDWNEPYHNRTWTWHLGFQGITLAEYHLLTGDRTVLRTLGSTMDLLREAQWQGEIRHWTAENIKNSDQETVDRHQALYAGGFGHASYSEIRNRPGQGYGPMQWPTCLAIMAWQLGSQCGIELKHPGVESAFTFLEYGTTKSGRIAYGGEFTMNNGPVDTAAWQRNTRHSFSHKSGLGYLVYMLSPERPDATSRMRLHLTNIDNAYKDMADGHACAMMGFTWGITGVLASNNEALKRKVMNYYKAWLNMARCHGSDSYVILPSRDYADYSYYRDNIRNHTTASVALIYSFSTPKLRIHGVQDGNVELVAAEMRLFHSADRSRSIEGGLVAYDAASATASLRLTDGTMREMPMDALSEEDRQYVLEWAAEMNP